MRPVSASSAAARSSVARCDSVSSRSGLAPQRAQRSGSIALNTASPSADQDQR